MTSAVLLSLLLLSLSAILVWQLTAWLAGRFFRLRRTAFQLLCMTSAAVFFAAGCIAVLFSLNSLRRTEYARGLADGAASVQTEPAASQEEILRGWKAGYGEGYTDGYAAAAAAGEARRTPAEHAETASSAPDSAPLPDAPAEENTATGAVPEKNAPDAVPDTDTDTNVQTSSASDASPASSDTEAEADSARFYYTPGGSVLHRDRSCSYLARAKEVLTCTEADAPDLPPCSRCG